MLKAILIILNSGFEVALVISLLLTCLRQMNKAPLSPWIYGGAGAATALGGFLAYNMHLLGGRELFEGLVRTPGLILTFLLLLWVWRELGKKPRKANLQSTGFTWALKVYLILTTFFLTVIPVVDMALFPNNIFIQTFKVINTELILNFSGGVIGLILCYLFSVALLKSSVKISPRKLVLVTCVTGMFLMVKQAVILAQILFATGMLPLTSLALSLLIPFLNNMDNFIYALLGTALLWVGLAAVSLKTSRQLKPGTLNPATKRKIKAASRSGWRWLGASASLIILITSLAAAHAAYGSRTIELSPATPVTAGEAGVITIPAATVNDSSLHRFGYTASDGTQVRFIVISKSETAFGVGLDACDICGPTGYYQRKDQVVCRNCDVVINISTIGFPGGCNPVPIDYRMKDGKLVINAADLEKEKERFQRTNIYES